MKFELTEKQVKKLEKWKKTLPVRGEEFYMGAIGGGETFTFTNTSVGTIITVKYLAGDHKYYELDLSDYEDW